MQLFRKLLVHDVMHWVPVHLLGVGNAPGAFSFSLIWDIISPVLVEKLHAITPPCSYSLSLHMSIDWCLFLIE
jgi:hypothetical protein